MGFHSKIKFEQSKTVMACGIPVLPVKTIITGPAKLLPEDCKESDIIDQAIMFFRANVLFKNYQIVTSADKIIVFLTVFIQKCLQTLAKLKSSDKPKESLVALSKKAPQKYETSDFMKPLLKKPSSPSESDTYVKYLTQLQQQTALRLFDKLYGPVTGMDLKFWLPFGKKRFMGFQIPN